MTKIFLLAGTLLFSAFIAAGNETNSDQKSLQAMRAQLEGMEASLNGYLGANLSPAEQIKKNKLVLDIEALRNEILELESMLPPLSPRELPYAAGDTCGPQ
ncbi:MAG: hypothetical protein V4534_06640 [Myxococcota bacterium]